MAEGVEIAERKAEIILNFLETRNKKIRGRTYMNLAEQ
jgi:hypothetical protein